MCIKVGTQLVKILCEAGMAQKKALFSKFKNKKIIKIKNMSHGKRTEFPHL